MDPPVITVGAEKDMDTALARAAEVILSGGVVAIPTESFYGLAVNATDERAIRRLLSIKKRREDHPVLILIPSVDALNRYVARVSPTARVLISRFWPGGLTLVFEAGPEISPWLTAGTGKIGVRLSSHPIATGLAKAVGLPITGTSANLTGEPACTSGDAVLETLGQEVDLILDGGKTAGGMGSTILDVTVDPPKILRKGMVGRDRLQAFIGAL